MNDDQAFIVSRADESAETLRERYQQWGYLFIKQFVPHRECDAMLADIIEAAGPYISSAKEHPTLEGEPFSETDPAWDEVYPEIQALETLHRFFHNENFRQLMSDILSAEPFVYPMKMARISTPGKLGFETPPHQDAHSHNAGPTMAGIWVALHDVPSNMGRVKVLPKSHLTGKRPVLEAQGVGGVQCEIYEHEKSWHVSDYEKGDVLIFNSCCVHRAEPNTHPQAVRISIDTRFCDHGAPVFSLNLEPHHGWRIPKLDWNYIYSGWQRDELKFYWESYPNLF